VFDIGPGEMIALAVVALLVIGPDKLPGYAADAARFVRQVRKMANDARTEVTKELGPDLDGLDLRELNPRALVKKHVLDGFELDLDDDEDDAPRRGSANGASANGSANGSSANASSTNGSSANGSGAVNGAAAEPVRAPFDPDTT
jgi:sec-independent protein translocase protein TatB